MKETMKEQVKTLWKLCFDDTDDFVDLYFRMRYTDAINSAAVEDGRVIAALQRIPYPMTYAGEVVPMAYISGACTHPDYRSRGVMRGLLDDAHRRMHADGVWFSTLIPAEEWLKGYYARSGYTTCFQQGCELLTACGCPVNNLCSSLSFSKIEQFNSSVDRSCVFFYEQMLKQPFCVQHTAEDLRVVLADLQLAGGELWEACASGGEPVGLAFCLYHEGRLAVKELVCTDRETEAQMLAFLFHHYQTEIIERTVCSRENLPDLGMARVVNVEKALELFAKKHSGVLCIRVTGDTAIAENNGCFLIEDGLCTRREKPGVPCHELTVGRLTALLFEGEHPYMNLMLN